MSQSDNLKVVSSIPGQGDQILKANDFRITLGQNDYKMINSMFNELDLSFLNSPKRQLYTDARPY